VTPLLDHPSNNLIESSIELNRNAGNILFHPQFMLKNIVGTSDKTKKKNLKMSFKKEKENLKDL
jgi:hypothetical protein